MTKLTMPYHALDLHRQAYSLGIQKILDRLSGKVLGKVYIGCGGIKKAKEGGYKNLLFPKSSVAVDFIKKIADFHRTHDVLTAEADSLMRLVATLKAHKLLSLPEIKERTFEFLKKVFNYAGFRDANELVVNIDSQSNDLEFYWRAVEGKILAWGGWRFIRSLGIKYCPYCNADSIYAVPLDSGRLIAGKTIQVELDHFMSQGDYPYLSLSLYNLIPSCHRCNSGLKHDAKIDFDNCLYPYRDSIHDHIKFRFTPSSISQFHGVLNRPGALGVKVVANPNDRSKKYLAEFRLKEVYSQIFVDEILDEYRAVRECSQLFNRMIKDFGLDKTYLLYHKHLGEENINQTRFGKVFTDLEELA